ncbi:MAG: C45 family peptidase [Armatimonadota bacterium]
MISLTGTPENLGRLWGNLNHADLVGHVADFLKLAHDEHGLTETTLVERSRRYDEVVGELAPHWHEESEAVARAAGIERDLYHAFLAGKYRGLLFAGDCSSYAAVGSATADGRPLFHKNRDNTLRPQAFYRKATELPGSRCLPFLAVGDTSDTGVMMMVNAEGLAGSADMAGADPDPYYNGIMNPYGLRLIAETARDCGEAFEIVRMMNDRGLYAGAGIATNWTFADRHGRAMVVYNSHRRVEITSESRDGFVIACERDGLRELLESRLGGLAPSDFDDASRLPGVCVEGNCSSLTVQIAPDAPETFTCAWAALGKADKAAYFPLYMGAAALPSAYADGTVFAYSQRHASGELIAACEDDWERQRGLAETQARKALADGRPLLARHHLQTVASYARAEAEKHL